MSIQSISIVVPTKACVNNCKFCVSKMHNNPYENNFDEIGYRKRIKHADRNGVNTFILTGTGEVLQNKSFLKKLKDVLDKERHPFPNVELQTSGVMLMDKLDGIKNSAIRPLDVYSNVELLKSLGVNTISLSVSDIFNSDNNWDIIRAPEKYRPSLIELCQFIKEKGFNLRLSLNMTNVYNNTLPENILNACSYLGADQITFRKLYTSGGDTPEDKWVKENACDQSLIKEIEEYVAGVPHHNNRGEQWMEGGKGKKGFKLPFGAWVYSIMGMSVAIDDDCMAKEAVTEDLKYVILRENGKLYWSWDDEGSLIF